MCAAWSARTRTSPSCSAHALEVATETARTNNEGEGRVRSGGARGGGARVLREEALVARGRMDGGRRGPRRLAEEGWVGIVKLDDVRPTLNGHRRRVAWPWWGLCGFVARWAWCCW